MSIYRKLYQVKPEKTETKGSHMTCQMIRLFLRGQYWGTLLVWWEVVDKEKITTVWKKTDHFQKQTWNMVVRKFRSCWCSTVVAPYSNLLPTWITIVLFCQMDIFSRRFCICSCFNQIWDRWDLMRTFPLNIAHSNVYIYIYIYIYI